MAKNEQRSAILQELVEWQSVYVRFRVLCFFLHWLCAPLPACTRLDDVTQSIALDYGTCLLIPVPFS